MLLEIPLCVSVTRRNVLYLLLYGSSCSLEGTSCISTTHLVMKSCTTGSVPAKIFLVVLCFFACHFIFSTYTFRFFPIHFYVVRFIFTSISFRQCSRSCLILSCEYFCLFCCFVSTEFLTCSDIFSCCCLSLDEV